MRTVLLFWLLISTLLMVQGQSAVLRGTVTDGESGEPLAGANLLANGTGVATELNGAFRLELPAGTYQLTISYVGYQTRQYTLTLQAGQELIQNFTLTASSQMLQMATVTSGRYERPLGEVTVSLEVLQPTLIANSNKIQLDDALEKIPGVNIIGGQANIRGGSGFSYGAGSRVLLLLDDIPILQADAGFPNWNDIPIESTAQVEVVKGASSALYGSAALNGVVNFRTAFATDSPETQFSLFGTTYFTPENKQDRWWDAPPVSGGGSILHKQKLGRFDLVTSAFYLNNNSWNDQTYSRYGRLNAQTRYRITDRLTVGVNVNANKGSNQDFFYWKADTARLRPANGTLSQNDLFRYNIDPHITYFDGAGNRHKILSRFFRVNNQAVAQRSNTSNQYYLEYQFQRVFAGTGLVLTTGLVGSGSRVKAELYGDTLFTSRNLAAYLNLEKELGERINLSAGFRYEENLLDNPGFQYPRGTVAPSREQEAKPVFRLGANYQAADFTYFRASWGQGYRFPSVAEKFIYTNTGGFLVSPSPFLQSETGWSAEVAVKQGFKISGFQGFLDLAAFYTRYNDMMEFNFVDLLTGFRSVNIGGTEIKGLELVLGGRGQLLGLPTTFTGGYLWIDPRFLAFDTSLPVPGEPFTQGQANANNSSSDEDVLKYRSRNSFKFDLESELGKSFSVGIAGNYASFQEAIDAPLEFFVQGLKTFRERYSNGFFILDLRAAYQLGEGRRLSLILDNALNETYSVRPGLMNAPRNISVRLDWHFDSAQ